MGEQSEDIIEQQTGEESLKLLSGVIRALDLYDVNNATVQRLLTQICELSHGYNERTNRAMALQIEGENFFINQRLLRLDRKAFDRTARIVSALEALDCNELEFSADVTPAQLSLFFKRLLANREADDEEGIDLSDNTETGVSARKSTGITKRGLSSDESKHRRSLRLYATLAILARDYVYRANRGQLPSTVSLRRVLQGLVDLAEEQGDLLIALTQQGDGRDGLAGHMTRSAVLTANLTLSVGLGRRMAGRAALVVFMSRLPLAKLGDRWAEAPPEVVSKTFDSSLKEIFHTVKKGRVSSWRLVLLYEALMGSLGNRRPYGEHLNTSFEGRLVEVATRYDQLRAGLGPKLRPCSPVEAIKRVSGEALEQNVGEGATLDRVFTDALRFMMGDVPPGSVLRTGAGTFGIVQRRPGIVEFADAGGHFRRTFRHRPVNKGVPLELTPEFDISVALGWEDGHAAPQATEALDAVEIAFDFD